MAVYQITVTGTTYGGSTSFFNETTTFTPVENFALTGFMITTPPQDNVGASGNGVNLFDFGFVVGNAWDFDVRAGELIWASNSALHPLLKPENPQGGPAVAAIDEVFQFVAENGVIVTQIDPSRAPTTNTDFFIQNSGLLGIPRQIVGGQIDMIFSQDGTTVSGQSVFYGGGIVEPGTFGMNMGFEGILIG